ncbi:MAG: hypothetical protein M3115_00290, partial [Thermoproteota archaeon]|nr:hypothetical protein [Thermoproteota archaeon]
MRSRKGLSTTLLGGGMIAMLSVSWFPMMTDEVFAAPDKFSMLSFSWLPMMTERMIIGPDKFGIEEIYPVANNGSIWYINNEDPQSDNNFYFRSLEDIELEEEEGQGEFRMDAETGTERHGVRIHVDSPKGIWKNVEMSGYFKLIDGKDEFTMIARHGPSYHENEGCDAYGYYGMLSAEGDAFFKKKTYHHGGGYTGRTAVAENVVSGLQDRWIGIKFMVYDAGNGQVKLELWIDDGDETNNWRKVTEYIDDGGWETDESHCDRPKDYIIDSGTRATFRVDDSEFEFKKLSVKEIEAEEATFMPYSIK